MTDFDAIVPVRVRVGEAVHTASDIVIATGSDPVIPPFPTFSEAFLHALLELRVPSPAATPA